MTEQEKLTTIAENVPKVFENGKRDGRREAYDAFWDAYQYRGGRRSYQYAFAGAGWTDETYNPKYDIVCSGGITSMFYYAKITDTKVTIDLSGITTSNHAFSTLTDLVTIRKLIVSETTPYLSTTFQSLNALENMIIEGTIGQNGFNVSWSTKLSHDSLMSIINALQDKTTDTSGTSWVCTLGTENLAKLTDEEKLVATRKGWSLA